MSSQSRNDLQEHEGSARDEQRTGIDFDLNCPPPREFIDFDLNCPPPSEFIEPTGPHEEEAQYYNRGQAMEDCDIVDDDIALISPRKFDEARKKFRRIRHESSCSVAVSNGNTKVYGALSDTTSRPPLTICSPRTTSSSNSISIVQEHKTHNLDLSLGCETSNNATEATIDTRIPSALAQNRCDPPAPVLRFQCVICIESIVDEATTICGHIFCKSCIEKAIATQHKCPVCRLKLKKRDIIRIYLPFSP